MSAKLPNDFDAKRYFAAYPDVALSGLSPSEHYLRFGRLLGRDPNGKTPSPKAVPAERRDIGPSVLPSGSPEKNTKTSAPIAPARSEAVIERPPDFNPSDVTPSPAPLKASSPDGFVTLMTLASGPFASPDDRGLICAPLAVYARMFGLDPVDGVERAFDSPSCGSRPFQIGKVRIDNSWFVDAKRLRLMLNGSQADSIAAGWSLRAYQADAPDPAALRLAGLGVQLPALGPVFVDLELVHPLMPLLLELSDSHDAVQAFALVPFPSLLPGGIHSAELKALQSEANPMDALWSLSETLLQETLGRPDWPERSIDALAVHSQPSDGAETALSPEIIGWLSAVFALSLVQTKKMGRAGLRLVLPVDGVPTISALASRRLEAGGAADRVGPFLIADADSMKPRWSVALPAGQKSDRTLPILQQGGRKSRVAGNHKPLPVHLAIALRTAEFPDPVGASKNSSAADAAAKAIPMTIVLSVEHPGRAEALLALMSDITSDPEILVRLPPDAELSRAMLDRVCGTDGWKSVGEADLRRIARTARHDVMLTLSDRISLEGPGVLETLCGLLESDDRIGSASCALLGETVFKKQAILQPASGGLFPARVAFASSPRLTFSEPDVFGALPDITYPVVANTWLLTVWKKRALAELPELCGPVPATAADIRLGIDLMDAGYRNLCTTKERARMSGTYARRDSIDPVGSAYLQPSRWEEILNSVTVLRELF